MNDSLLRTSLLDLIRTSIRAGPQATETIENMALQHHRGIHDATPEAATPWHETPPYFFFREPPCSLPPTPERGEARSTVHRKTVS